MLLNLFELKKRYSMHIRGVVHIGAHFGEEHEVYKQLGISNIIYFEPVKKTFKILQTRIKDAQLFNYALGNDNKEIEMYIEKLDSFGCSSILEPSSNYPNDIFEQNKEIVKMRKLDSFNIDEQINFLNIDTQGYELEVLRGAEKTLEKIDYIICEVNRDTTYKILDYKNASLITEIQEYLHEKSFKLVETDWSGISWGDALFVKEKCFDSTK